MSISRDTAVAAATKIAADLGLRGVTPRLLRDGSNVLVHLRPEPLVARVATVTAAIRPGVHRWLTSDIALARYLDARGLPVVRPSDDPPAGPHDVDGITVALWQHVPHDPAATVAPAELVSILGKLHAALRDYPDPLADGPSADFVRVLALLERSRLVEPAVLARLRADGERLAERVSALPAQPLHGDAHPGNVLVTPDGPVWNDFEDAWVGPPAWDYACVANSSRSGDWVRAVHGHADPDALAVCRELRAAFGVAWYQLLAHRFPDTADDARRVLAEYL
jgi:Phosphotransferase enzyme family